MHRIHVRSFSWHKLNVYQFHLKDYDKDISLIELASEAQSFNRKLQNVDEFKKDCLKAFCDSSDLIKWLRSSLSGKARKTFYF